MRPSSLALSLLLLLALTCLFVLSPASAPSTDARRDANRAMVERYGITDLALFTEARYTRHPSQADLHSAFQDHPGALEHFPTGSLLQPHRPILTQYAPLARETTPSD